MITKGILVIQNVGGFCHLEIPYKASYPYKKVWKKYRGVGGGFTWPDIGEPTPQLADGLAPVESLAYCRKYWGIAQRKYPRDRINLLAVGDVKDNDNARFVFLGYDCGIIDEYNNFSAILDDLIYRIFHELLPFQHALNKNLLFSSPVDAEAFLVKRQELLRQGYPLETDEDEFSVIPIYSIAFML